MNLKSIVFAATAALLLTTSQVSAQQKSCNVLFWLVVITGLLPFFTNPNGGAPQTDCEFQVWSWTAFVNAMRPTRHQAAQIPQLPTYDDLKSGNKLRAASARARSLSSRARKSQKAWARSIRPSGGVLIDQKAVPSTIQPTWIRPISRSPRNISGPRTTPTRRRRFPTRSGRRSTKPRGASSPTARITHAYTTTATIDLLESDGKGGVKMSGKTQSGVPVALVGVHVVGVIHGHPEFVWGTFEQVNNAPDLPPGVSPKSGDPVSQQKFTFYKAGSRPTTAISSPPR